MASAWHEVSDDRRAARWVGLLGVLLIGACGGDREEAPAAGTGVASADTAAAPADTAAPVAPGADTTTAADTAGGNAAAAFGDTAPVPGHDTATQPSKPAPTKPAPPTTQPSEPAQAPAAKPKPAPTPQPATADTTAAQDTAAAGAQDETETAAAPLRDAYHQAPKDTVSQEVYDGWKQYNLNCARCHGEDVLGSTIAPHLVMSLKPDGPVNTQEAFVQVVCAGRPEKGMPSWCALGMEPAKINQIYAYVKGRSEGEIGPGRPALREGS